MDKAEHKFVEVWIRLTCDWAKITTFRQMGILGEDAAREAMHRTNTYFVQQQVMNGEYQHFLKDKDSFIRGGFAEEMPNSMTEQAVTNFRQTLHASTLVFAHSILDAAIYDCICICGMAAPKKWTGIGVVSNRKVVLSDIATKSYDELLIESVNAEIHRLERESLITKIDRIFQICKPSKPEYLTNGFRFDRERLQKLDDFRHKVVHASGNVWSFDTIYEDLQFMQNTGLHIFSMVGECFNLFFSADEAMQVLAKWNISNNAEQAL